MVANPVKRRSTYRRPAGEVAFDVVIHVLLTIAALATLYPFLYVLSMSISDPGAVVRGEVWLLPKGFSVESYKLVFDNPSTLQAYYNTLWYTVVGTLVNVSLTISAAYALSRREFFVRRILLQFIVVTLFFEGGLIPLFLVVNSLGLYNSRWALVLPTAVNAFNLIIARTYFESSIPESLPESAKIDGANDIRIFTAIVLPVSMPIIAVMTIFYGVYHWNAWFEAAIFLSDQELRPLQLFLREILLLEQSTLLEGFDADFIERAAYAQQIKYGAIMIVTLPIIFIYPFFQRYFIKGVMLGAI
jgi:putative aldouronate transport system permease protein